MSRIRKAAPKDPQVAAAEKRAQAFAAVNLSPESSALPALADIEANRSSRTNADQARRMDAFEALRDSLTDGAYDAARELEAAIVTMMGEHDRGRSFNRVDCDRGGDRTDTMLAARDQVIATLSRIGERDAWLLSELIYPGPACKLMANTWRDVVAYVTGETHTHAQAAAVRSACANLAALKARQEVAA